MVRRPTSTGAVPKQKAGRRVNTRVYSTNPYLLFMYNWLCLATILFYQFHIDMTQHLDLLKAVSQKCYHLQTVPI
jgi:hypothetical protein